MLARSRVFVGVAAALSTAFGFVACVTDSQTNAPVYVYDEGGAEGSLANEDGSVGADATTDAGALTDASDAQSSFDASDGRTAPPTATGALSFAVTYPIDTAPLGYASYVAVDVSGNTYVAFQFAHDVLLDGDASAKLTHGAGIDIGLVKFDKTGAIVWAKSWDSGDDDLVTSLAADTDAYLSGVTKGVSLSFGASATVTKLGGEGSDPFVAKISGAGAGLWATNFAKAGACDQAACTQLSVKNGHVGVACSSVLITQPLSIPKDAMTREDAVMLDDGFDFDNGAVVMSLAAATGFAEWHTTVGSDPGTHTTLTGLAVDRDGTIAVAANSDAPSFYDTGKAFSTANPRPAGVVAMFVTKLQTDGKAAWAKVFADSSAGLGVEATGGGIAIDSLGDVVVGGKVTGANVPTGTNGKTLTATAAANGWADGFVAKLDPKGITQWTFVLGGGYQDEQAFLAVDAWDEIVLVGRYQSSTITVGSSPKLPAPWIALTSLDSGNGTQAYPFGPFGFYTAKLSANGNGVWGFGQIGTDEGGLGNNPGVQPRWTEIGPAGADPQSAPGNYQNVQATPVAVDSTGAVVTLASVPAYATLTLDGGTSSIVTTNRSFILTRRAP